MLTEHSFLNNLHVGIVADQRITLEGAGFAIESVGYAYNNLRKLAGEFAALSEKEYIGFPITPLFVHAWAIVDGAHFARSLLKNTTFSGDPVRLFIERTEIATKLRNKFDHISSNVRNLAGKKDPMALFGALTMHHVRDEHISVSDSGAPVLNGCRLLQINSGKPTSMLHKLAENKGEAFTIERPVGRFLLQAFDLQVDLSALAFAVRDVVSYYDDVVKPDIDQQVRDAAEQQNVDPEEAVGNTGISVVWQADIRFVAPSEPPTAEGTPD